MQVAVRSDVFFQLGRAHTEAVLTRTPAAKARTRSPVLCAHVCAFGSSHPPARDEYVLVCVKVGWVACLRSRSGVVLQRGLLEDMEGDMHKLVNW